MQLVLGDGVVLASAFLVASFLRLELAAPAGEWKRVLVQLPLLLVVQLLALAGGRAYGRRSRIPGWGEVRAFAAAAAASITAVLLVRIVAGWSPAAPAALRPAPSTVVVGTVLGFGAALLARFLLAAGRERGPAPPPATLDALLARSPVTFESDARARFLAGRRVLVTGAGGSIGAELAQQVAAFDPELLLLVERSEPALFGVHRSLVARRGDSPVLPLVADAGDEARMRALLVEHRPQVVLHAAAHKHVPLLERDNVGEAVRNNVLATHLLGSLAGELGVETFVLVSTDKAVRPSSVMGATKRLAEVVVQHLDAVHPTRYVAVRFGNVLGSSGSVIPIFREQIAAGGPVTVTHPDMVRYFMTMREAVQLVLHAATLGRGGEIFVLDMGEPVRIVDLARAMIRRSGLEPEVDMEIRFTGVRPGEKLVEELQQVDGTLAPTAHPRILVGRLPPRPAEEVLLGLERLRSVVAGGRADEVRRCLAQLVPEACLEGVSAPPALAVTKLSG